MKNNNQLMLKLQDNSLRKIDKVAGLKIDFLGHNSKFIIGEGSIFRNSAIKIASNSSVVIEKTASRGINNLIINMDGSPNSELKIGKGFSIEGGYFGMANEASLAVKIGEGCMFSSSIIFTATDGHVIYDRETKEIINAAKPIHIGNHVWLGHSATVLKGAVIPSDSIVGACSVVAKNFLDDHVILAGNPAKVVKRNINWSKRSIAQYEREEGDKFVSVNIANKQLHPIQITASQLFGVFFRLFINSRQLKKLRDNPVAFFQDSHSFFTRVIGKILRIT